MRDIICFALLVGSVTAQAESIFAKGSDWEVVTEGHQFAEGMAFGADGNLVFTDVPRSQLFVVDGKTGKKKLVDGNTGKANGITFGPDGRLYGCASGDKKIYAWDPETWEKEAVAEGVSSNDIAIRKDGTIFFSDPRTQSVWRITAKARKLEKAAELKWKLNGVTLSLDGKTLYVAEFPGDTVHAFPIADDNSLGDSRPEFKLMVPEGGKGCLDGMFVHHDGRLVSGTVRGAQIATAGDDPEAIVIPIPDNLPRCNYVRISPDRKWLYSAHAKAILRRELDSDFAGAFGN